MTFTAYTSPNNMFDTAKELSFKVAHALDFNPYGIIAFELSGAADTSTMAPAPIGTGRGPDVSARIIQVHAGRSTEGRNESR